MASPPAPVILVRYYMYHYATSNNYPFGGNYKTTLAPYLIGVVSPTNALGPADVTQQIYAASGDALTAFLLWMATPGMNVNVDLGRIVLLHSVYQLASHMGRPATKWESKAFAATGDVVAGTVALANLEPRYLNLLRHLVNVPSSTMIFTVLVVTPPPILLDTVIYGDIR